MMYELHRLIEKLQERKMEFEYKYAEEDDLVKVKKSLNQRLVTLNDLMVDDPTNEALIFEYSFCQEEADRINDRLEEIRKKYSTRDAKIEKYEKLINYDLQEMYSYLDLMKQFSVDDKLQQAMQDALKSLDENITKLNELQQE